MLRTQSTRNAIDGWCCPARSHGVAFGQQEVHVPQSSRRDAFPRANSPKGDATKRRCFRHRALHHDSMSPILQICRYLLRDNQTLTHPRQVMAETLKQSAQPKGPPSFAAHYIPEDVSAELVYLYRLVEGASLSSHGYHCALKAGMPLEIIQRAQHVSAQ